MRIQTKLRMLLTPWFKNHPQLKNWLVIADTYFDLWRHSVALLFPQIIRPDPRSLFVAVTASCNLRCIGCRYGRDFMPGQKIPLSIVSNLIDDAKNLGFKDIRFYGGEPLLHPDLPSMIKHSMQLGLDTWISTNGVHLKDKIDELYKVGLRKISIGFYGIGENYNKYVQRKDSFAQMEAGVKHVREHYGMEVKLILNWLLMRPSCNLSALQDVWQFAKRYNAPISVNLIHYSLPYFTEGPDRQLQFCPEDYPAIKRVVEELIYLKHNWPELLETSIIALRSIPDWLINGPNMKVPCERYRLIWVGANGTVQLCYVTFKLGNLHEKRLTEILFTSEHRLAARNCFRLKCPNCHCGYYRRTLIHAHSRRLYK